MSIIKEIFRVRKMRKIAVRDAKLNNGRCPWCGKLNRHTEWCMGPKFIVYLWNTIRRPRLAKTIFRIYKNELKWAGVEPWHRH